MSHPLRTRTFADTQAEDIAWLWPGRIACGKVTVVVADGGVGKSLLTSRLAAGVTRGHLGSDTSPGRVLHLNLEDTASDVEEIAAGPADAPAPAALVAPGAQVTSAAIGGADTHDGRFGSAPARARRGRGHP